MSNNFFEFKQFKINQDQTAMKVGTDGVLLGAWANCENTELILDIGTGTGLLALMLAQRSQARIVAIEIDKQSAIQAQENIDNSSWNKRIQIIETDFCLFQKQTNLLFDLIVSNPPYFQNSYKAKGSSRTLARHTDSLSFSDLFAGASQILTEKGRLLLILPYEVEQSLISLALKVGLYCRLKTIVYPNELKTPKRVLFEFCKDEKTICIVSKLIIETDERHQYTTEFVELVKDFYLKM